MFALLFSLVFCTPALADGAPKNDVGAFITSGLSIGKHATVHTPWATLLVTVPHDDVVHLTVDKAHGGAPATALPGLDAFAGSDAARAVQKELPPAWVAKGGQHASEAQWDDKVYWVKVIPPQGAPITFETTWKGSYGRQVTADHVLVDAARRYVQAASN